MKETDEKETKTKNRKRERDRERDGKGRKKDATADAFILGFLLLAQWNTKIFFIEFKLMKTPGIELKTHVEIPSLFTTGQELLDRKRRQKKERKKKV